MRNEEKVELGKLEAVKALRSELPPGHVVRAEEMDVASFASVRGDYVICYENMFHPDFIVVLQHKDNRTYTAVYKMLNRYAVTDTDPLPGLERI